MKSDKTPMNPASGANLAATETPMWNDPAEPAYVRELLQVGRSETVSYDVSQGLAKHLANITAGAPLPDWAQAGASAGASSSAWLSWLVLPVVAATAATGLWFATHAKQPVAPAQIAKPAATMVTAAPQPAVAVVAPVAPAAEPAQAEPVSPTALPMVFKQARPAHKLAHGTDASGAKLSVAAEKQLDTEKLMSAPVASATSSRSSTSHGSPTSASAVARTTGHEAVEPSAPAAEPAAAAPQAAQAEKSSDSRLEREMQMLAVAQRVLSSDPTRALRLAEQGEREFPHTMFSAERQQLGLLALVKLGRLDEARRVGTPFLAKYPNAPWSARLRRALATGRVE